MKKITLISAAIIIATNLAFSQGTAINKTGAAAHNSALLDLSDTTKGILIPRMKKVNKLAISNPATGLMVYQTDDTTGFWYYNGVKWVQSIGPAGVCGGGGNTYPCYTTPGTASANPSSGVCGFSSVLSVSGHNGNIQWQTSSDNLYFVDIPNANSSNYNVTMNDSAAYYVAKVTAGTCAPAFSNVITLTATGCVPIGCNAYGWSDYEEAYSMIKTSDGGYAIAGNIQTNNTDFHLMKINSSGYISWSRSIGGTGNEYCYSVIQTNDGGFALCGNTYSYGYGDTEVYAVKFDANGNLQWTRSVGGTKSDVATSMIQLDADSSYILAGYSNSFSPAGHNVYVVKIDKNGVFKWANTYGAASNEFGFAITKTSDGGFAISGAAAPDGILLKFDAGCNLSWVKTYSAASYVYGYSIVQTSDLGYAITGYTGAGPTDIYVVKLSSAGNFVWSKTIGGSNSDYGWSIIQTTDGGYAIAGYTESYGAGAADIFVVKLSDSGTMQWSKSIGTSTADNARGIVQTGDGGYIVGGTTSYSNSGDFYLVKLDASGNSCCTTTQNPVVNSSGSAGSISFSSDSGGADMSGGVVKTSGTKTTICK